MGGVPAGHGRRSPAGDHGASLAELAIVLAIIGAMAGMAVPVTARAIDASRARDAAGFMAARFRLARAQAVAETRSIGVVFDQIGGRWTFRVCVDGNGNGIRRADVASGVDTCTDGPVDIGQMFAGVDVAVDAALPGPDDEAGSADPVRFGQSDVASFSSTGTCTAGTVFLRSARGQQYAIRVSNVTGRTRVLRYDAGTGRWSAA